MVLIVEHSEETWFYLTLQRELSDALWDAILNE